MIAFGAPEEVLAALPEPKSTIEIFPENWDAVLMFTQAGTQWRTAGTMDGIKFIGLDYNAVEILVKINGIEARPELFSDLQTMEFAARKIMNGG